MLDNLYIKMYQEKKEINGLVMYRDIMNYIN